jgi:hypothetical protein
MTPSLGSLSFSSPSTPTTTDTDREAPSASGSSPSNRALQTNNNLCLKIVRPYRRSNKEWKSSPSGRFHLGFYGSGHIERTFWSPSFALLRTGSDIPYPSLPSHICPLRPSSPIETASLHRPSLDSYGLNSCESKEIDDLPAPCRASPIQQCIMRKRSQLRRYPISGISTSIFDLLGRPCCKSSVGSPKNSLLVIISNRPRPNYTPSRKRRRTQGHVGYPNLDAKYRRGRSTRPEGVFQRLDNKKT